MATGSQKEQIQGADGNELDARNFAERLDYAAVILVNNKRAPTLTEATVAALAFAGTKSARLDNLLDVGIGSNPFQDLDSGLCLGDRLDFVGEDERKLANLLDAVATSKYQARDGRGSNCRNSGIAALIDIHLAMPAAPGLCRSKHTASTTAIGESPLTRTMGAAARNARHTSYSAPSPPRLGRVLMAGLFGDGIRLAPVLGNVRVDKGDDIGADGSAENGGHVRSLVAVRAIEGKDFDERTCGE